MPNRSQFTLKIVSFPDTIIVLLVFVIEEKLFNFCFLIGSVNFLDGWLLSSHSVTNIWKACSPISWALVRSLQMLSDGTAPEDRLTSSVFLLSGGFAQLFSRRFTIGWSKKHQFFRINFFFWIGVRNVLKFACVKYFYLIPLRNVPTLWSKFPYFQPYLPKQTSFG